MPVTSGRWELRMNNQKIGTYICMLRKDKQLTQKELADKLGVTDKAVSKWERGAGYPDISMLKPLSEILGVSVNELLDGEDKSAESIELCDDDIQNNSVTRVLEYADHVMKRKEHSIGRIFSWILGISLFLAVFICFIVNIATEENLSWFYIVAASCVFGGSLLIPPMLYKGHGFLVSLRFLTILILPFLAVIQYVTGKYSSRPEWLWSVAMPISFTWLFILWLSVVFYKYKKMKLWLTLAITTLLCIPGEAITNTIASGYDTTQLMPVTSNVSIVFSAFILLCIAGVFVLIGLTKQNSRQKAS